MLSGWLCCGAAAKQASCLSTLSLRRFFYTSWFESTVSDVMLPSALISGVSGVLQKRLFCLHEVSLKGRKVSSRRCCHLSLGGNHNYLLKMTVARAEAWFQDSWECQHVLKTRVFWLQGNLEHNEITHFFSEVTFSVNICTVFLIYIYVYSDIHYLFFPVDLQ